MTDLQEKAMRMALEALEHIHRCIGSGAATIHWDSATWHQSDATIGALRQALAQSEQNPVAWMYTSHYRGNEWFITRNQSDLTTYKADKVRPLYTTPPKREWVGLTDEEFRRFSFNAPWEVVQEIEAKLKEKNS